MFVPMILQGVGAIVNIVLDPILIFGLLGLPALVSPVPQSPRWPAHDSLQLGRTLLFPDQPRHPHHPSGHAP